MEFYNNLFQNSGGKPSRPMSVEFFMNFDFYENGRTWKECQKLFTNNKQNLRLAAELI